MDRIPIINIIIGSLPIIFAIKSSLCISRTNYFPHFFNFNSPPRNRHPPICLIHTFITQSSNANHTGNILVTQGGGGIVVKPVLPPPNHPSSDPTNHPIGVAAVTAQSMTVSSHASMPAQPQRPQALATPAPARKQTPPAPPNPSVTLPTPPAPTITTPSPQVQPITFPPVTAPSDPNIISQPDLLASYNSLASASIPTTQSAVEPLNNLKKDHMSLDLHPISNNSMNILQDMKNSLNMMPASLPANLNLASLNMSNLGLNLQQGLAQNPMSIHNQLESMINTTSQLSSIQNSHMMGQQQHSNGYKRETSPQSLLNNNGIPGINLGMGMGGISSIFDPPIVTMPMMPQMPVKKEEKPIVSQAQMHKPMDGFFGDMTGLIPPMSNHGQMVPEKKMTPPDSKNPAGNFAAAFKNKQVEQNVKNASSWSSLAQASSPQSTAGSSMKTSARDSFQAFKKQAKEKEERRRVLVEQQEQKRQKELAEKERMRMENERRQREEDDAALEKAMKTVTDQHGTTITATTRAEEIKATIDTDSSSPNQTSGSDKAAAERERQRQREQERRRREAVS